MDIYVINLKRRKDRRSSIEARLRVQGLSATFVDAVDVREISDVPSLTQISPQRYCIWESHVRAMREIERSSSQYTMILEDDAVLHPRINWTDFLAAIESQMSASRYDKLQLGFIQAAYQVGSLKQRVVGIRGSRSGAVEKVTIDRRQYKVDLGLHRPGSHCYLLSSAAAHLLPQLNNPAWSSTDAFFDRVASASQLQGRLRMGSFRKSLAGQESRTSSGSSIDSDNSP